MSVAGKPLVLLDEVPPMGRSPAVVLPSWLLIPLELAPGLVLDAEFLS